MQYYIKLYKNKFFNVQKFKKNIHIHILYIELQSHCWSYPHPIGIIKM